MLKIQEYIQKLSPLSDEAMQDLLLVAEKIYLKPKEYFVKLGEYANQIGFLEEGIIRAYYTNSEGKEYNKNLFSAPAIIGSYVSLITHQPNQLPQQALTDSLIWKISISDLENITRKHCDLERLRRVIAEYYFVQKEKREVEMALLDADERYRIFQKEYPGVELQIPQYHIASYLGISATQLSRIRKKRAQS